MRAEKAGGSSTRAKKERRERKRGGGGGGEEVEVEGPCPFMADDGESSKQARKQEGGWGVG